MSRTGMHQDDERPYPYDDMFPLNVRRPTWNEAMSKHMPSGFSGQPQALREWDSFLKSLEHPFDEPTKKRLGWVRWALGSAKHSHHFSEETARGQTHVRGHSDAPDADAEGESNR